MYLYIIVIGWMYVVLLMAATEKTLTAGVLTFLGYGLLPCAVLVGAWALARPRRRSRLGVGQDPRQPDRPDPQRDQ